MDEIEFGQVEIREPESEVRPDRDMQYCAIGCGQINPDHLPIFVDLDVMRDMEGHARTNTRVELGGVLLGGKFIDQDGMPFIIIREALRAEHYEATRGSFKFTHETWAQFGRDREELPDDMHLVGWYHTHPDWGVFLSGMDLFICDNFFNDDLDVDLVIDPCRGDRGWFFWDTVDGVRQKVRADGFYLYSNRYRRTEVLEFAGALAGTDPAYFDPRYENSMGESAMQPIVNIHDQKSPVLMVAVLGMLTIQMLVLALIAWRVVSPGTDQVVQSQQREEVYDDILKKVIGSEDPNKGMLAGLADLTEENLELRHNLEGNSMLLRQKDKMLSSSSKELQKKNKSIEAKNEKLFTLEAIEKDLKARLDLEMKANEKIKEGKTIGGLSWWIAGSLAFATALVGLFAGTFFGRRTVMMDDEYASKESKPAPLKSEFSKPRDDGPVDHQKESGDDGQGDSDADVMTFRAPDEEQ